MSEFENLRQLSNDSPTQNPFHPIVHNMNSNGTMYILKYHNSGLYERKFRKILFHCIWNFHYKIVRTLKNNQGFLARFFTEQSEVEKPLCWTEAKQ